MRDAGKRAKSRENVGRKAFGPALRRHQPARSDRRSSEATCNLPGSDVCPAGKQRPVVLAAAPPGVAAVEPEVVDARPRAPELVAGVAVAPAVVVEGRV